MRADIPALNSDQLPTYNNQHEEWLLFAKKIRKGLGNGTALDDIREFIIYFWEHTSKIIFAGKRESLYPL